MSEKRNRQTRATQSLAGKERAELNKGTDREERNVAPDDPGIAGGDSSIERPREDEIYEGI